jgi:hypothetical protein
MAFKQFTERMVTQGIGRVGKNTAVLATDPVNMADLMSNSTFVWSTTDNWSDLGATEGGVNMTHGFAVAGVRVDQSDSEFKRRITDNTYTISTQLAHVGDIEIFREAWLAADTTEVVVTTSERIKGLAARRTVPRKSMAVATVDEADILRVFYFREGELEPGDSQLALTDDGVQVLPVTWRAFPKSSAPAQKEFGFIIEDNNFGGVANP